MIFSGEPLYRNTPNWKLIDTTKEYDDGYAKCMSVRHSILLVQGPDWRFALIITGCRLPLSSLFQEMADFLFNLGNSLR